MANPDREAVLALLDQVIRAEARDDPPPQDERNNWLYGSVDPVGFTQPDEHGWMAIIPAKAKGWIPRALVFWRTALPLGSAVSRGQMRHPAHSLTRWPTVEAAVGDYLFAPSWPIEAFKSS